LIVPRELDGAYVHREEVYADYFCDFWNSYRVKPFCWFIGKEIAKSERNIFRGK